MMKQQRRFALTGGSARYCLSQSEQAIITGKTLIVTALARMNGPDQLRDFLNGNTAQCSLPYSMKIFVLQILLQHLKKLTERFSDVLKQN
jgi:hypothetical protein